ncbi:Thg1 C terminal domain-containing protein [Collybia nuda]|uniref:tRNA(His) guanylyltransferase n=1 Tax=Collybia nuda TaxID=64659 RepID=A0A9P5XU12_9AGAR|nr:Thg1 C terminal domain-containing protein [Collybia nuda]
MAGTKYAYVRTFELPDTLLPGTFMVFRLDGHSFHRFSDMHNFTKPNDARALQLMDHAARDIMEEYPDIVLGFGESDEFSFLLRKSTTLYNRRESKIVSTLTSLFTSSYVFHWPEYFPNNPLKYPPSFDGRIVLYPADNHVRDYFAWRQADTHINNLYNTVFWALVQQGKQTTAEAHATLRGTVSKEKHEILFSRFNINYNQLNEQFKKGSVLVREEIPEPQLGATPAIPAQEDNFISTPETSPTGNKKKKEKRKAKPKTHIVVLHCDIIQDGFWITRPGLLID